MKAHKIIDKDGRVYSLLADYDFDDDICEEIKENRGEEVVDNILEILDGIFGCVDNSIQVSINEVPFATYSWKAIREILEHQKVISHKFEEFDFPVLNTFYENKNEFKNCDNCKNNTDYNEVDRGCYMCCKGIENNYEPIAGDEVTLKKYLEQLEMISTK